VSSQTTLEAVMNAEMNRRWPIEPLVAGKRSFDGRVGRVADGRVADGR